MGIYNRLKEMSVELPVATTPNGAYRLMSEFGDNLLYTSGTGCALNGKPISIGKLGKEVSIEEGKAAAKQCILNILSNIHLVLSDLNRIESVVKTTVYVAGTDDFTQQSTVADGASLFLVDLLGEKGKGARCAIGVNALPKNQSVEIEIIFQLSKTEKGNA